MKAIQFTVGLLLSTVGTLSAFTVTTNNIGCGTALFSTTEGTPAPAAASAPAAPATAASTAAAPVENNQPKYGKELEMPDTYVRCGRCQTSYALKVEDLGQGKGRRVECPLCTHSWFQSRDRLFTLNQGLELIPLPKTQLDRIESNLKKGRDPDYIGDTKFFVGNLDFGVVEEDLRALFAEKGEVGDVALITGPDGRSKGFAFITMMDKEVKDTCLELDGYELKGRNINVKIPN